MPSPRSRLTRRESAPQARVVQSNENVQISGTAIAFLVPLFLFFIFGPITLVVIIKRRRRNGVDPLSIRTRGRITGRPKKITREEARRILEGCTGVVKVEKAVGKDGEESGSVDSDVGKDRVGGEADAGSVSERECAICLTTLYGPSPPSPAKLPIKIAAKPEPESAEPGTDQSEEGEKEKAAEDPDILRLNVCNHEFHAECLTGWFIFGKFSCPICRSVFYGEAKEEDKEGESSETQTEASQRGNSLSRLAPIEEEEEGGPERRREEV